MNNILVSSNSSSSPVFLHVRQSSIDRCAKEIAEIEAQTDKPAWLVTLGVEDWECEKRFTHTLATEGITGDIRPGGSMDARQSARTFREIPPSPHHGLVSTVAKSQASASRMPTEAKT